MPSVFVTAQAEGNEELNRIVLGSKILSLPYIGAAMLMGSSSKSTSGSLHALVTPNWTPTTSNNVLIIIPPENITLC